MSKPSEICIEFCRNRIAPDGISAAKRREIAAHSASCGWQEVNDQAPKGRKNAYLRSRTTMMLGISIALLCITTVALAQSLNEQLPAGPAKETAQAACLACHEARIIVQQRLSKAAWTKEVDKMAKWGAEVDPKDHDALVDYLSANFGPDQPAYQAPRSAVESKSKTKTKH